AVAPEALAASAPGEASADVAARAARARERQIARQGCRNADLAGDALDRHCALDAAASKFVQAAAARLGWSARSFHRVLRIARSVADVEGAQSIQTAHLAEAIQYRRVLAVS
ncbi:MAG TPA: ATP-dependent protease, partial [Burkholderiaceae bacterium]|nr:ATP-dependent protease [Burkholderiaceae bacterium]